VDILWSPWRMAYISPDSAGSGEASGPAPAPDPAPNADACVFCDLPAQGPAHDRENLLLLRAETMFVILNRYPYNSGHLMIIPYRHLRDIGRLTPAECAEMMALLQRMVAALTAEYRPQGFNVGMNLGEVAGAGIAGHLHMHVVPRWGGDTNFMPVVGATKVLPEALSQTWTRLCAALERLG
jgi:ATP adenylyltransferase